MGIMAGLVWIIIGVCYMVYKYFREEGRQGPVSAVTKIIAGFVIFIVGGSLLKAVSENVDPDIGLFFIYFLVLPGCLFVLGAIIWCIVGDVQEATKDETLRQEAGNQTSMMNCMSSQEKTFMANWLRKNDELLNPSEVREMIAKDVVVEVATPKAPDEEATEVDTSVIPVPKEADNTQHKEVNEEYHRFLAVASHPVMKFTISAYRSTGRWPEDQYVFTEEIYEDFAKWLGKDALAIRIKSCEETQ